VGGTEGTQDPILREVFDRLKKWVPADTLGVFVPLITFVSAGSGKASLLLLGLMVVVTPIFVLGAAFAKGQTLRNLRVWVSAGLALVAFTIWSVPVPLSGWGEISMVKQNTPLFVVAAVILGIAFSYFAEGVTLRVAQRSN
jgi:hypothetical protein